MTTILHPDGSSLTIDALIGGSLVTSDQVTSHPVDDSSAVADHVNLGPRTLSLQIVQTEAPREDTTDTSGPDRIIEIRDFLESCRGQRLSVLLDDKRFPQIDDLVLQRSAETIRRQRDLPVDLEFVQVRVATQGSAQIPQAVRQSSAFKRPADGSDQGAGASGSAAETADASLLVTLFGG